MSDPIFTYQLALELHMSVEELGHRMSAHELSVGWPAFFAWRERTREREEKKERAKARGRPRR